MKSLILISVFFCVLNLQAQVWFQGGQSSDLNVSEFSDCSSLSSVTTYSASTFGGSGADVSQVYYCTSMYSSSSIGASGGVLTEVNYCSSIYRGEEQSGGIFALGSCLTSLPIELGYFDATALKKEVLLEWETYSEINNNYFLIERSIDAIIWRNVVKIDGAGNSTSVLYYSTVDNAPLKGISYYRLKQVDYDGQFSYSQVKAVVFNGTSSQVSIFPNPANTTVSITGKLNADSILKIYNYLGQDVTHFAKVISKNKTKIELDIRLLESGTYLIKTGNTLNKLIKI